MTNFDPEFLLNILRSSGEDVELVQSTVSALGSCADALTASLIFVTLHCKVNGREETRRYVIKRKITEGPAFIQIYLKIAGVFDKEEQCYKTVLPAMDKVVDISTPTFFGSDGENVALADVRPDGYRPLDKSIHLTYNGCVLALQELAKLHAASYAYKTTMGSALPDLFPCLTEMFITPANAHIFTELFDMPFRKVVYLLPLLNRNDLAVRLEKHIGRGYDHLQALRCDSRHKWAVMCHGDYWRNNVLFKSDNDPTKTPTKAMMIDFQGCHAALPSLDLCYFMYTSVDARLRRKYSQTLLAEYYDTFRAVMTKKKIKEYFTFDELQEMMRNTLMYALFYMCFAVPLQTTDDDGDDDDKPEEKKDVTQDAADASDSGCKRLPLDSMSAVELEELYVKDRDASLGPLFTAAYQPNTKSAKRILEIIDEIAEANVF